jgi:DNA-binding NarL/FixJ family response regulator
MLRNSGLSDLEAADGTTAIAAIREDSAIDVLLLDITLPGASSREVLAEAKRLRPTMRVMVTSLYAEEFAATSLQADVERFIRKSIRSAILRNWFVKRSRECAEQGSYSHSCSQVEGLKEPHLAGSATITQPAIRKQST